MELPPSYTHTHTHTHKCVTIIKHTHTHIKRSTHTHTHPPTPTHTHTHTHTHSTHPHALTRTHTHTCTHTHTHSYTHTHRHTQIGKRMASSVCRTAQAFYVLLSSSSSYRSHLTFLSAFHLLSFLLPFLLSLPFPSLSCSFSVFHPSTSPPTSSPPFHISSFLNSGCLCVYVYLPVFCISFTSSIPFEHFYVHAIFKYQVFEITIIVHRDNQPPGQ